MTLGNRARDSDREACISRVLAMPLTSDRWTEPCYPTRLTSVGQFRTADGLVLPSGRKLGPQISCRSRVTLVG
jgi:hypothetical protein